MNESLRNTAKTVGELIIDLSEKTTSQMELWADATARPNGLSAHECVGFKASDNAPLQLIVDLIAPLSGSKATLRLWVIKSDLDDQGNDRFNNIQLNFRVVEQMARGVASKGAAVTRYDLKNILLSTSTELERLIVSDESGMNQKNQQLLGTRYDINNDSQDDVDLKDIEVSIQKVIARLQSSVSN